MLPRNHPDRIRITFDDHRLVANAGLLLPSTLARRLGLPELVHNHLDLGRAPGRANTGDKMMTLVASALAGGDCIDDAGDKQFQRYGVRPLYTQAWRVARPNAVTWMDPRQRQGSSRTGAPCCSSTTEDRGTRQRARRRGKVRSSRVHPSARLRESTRSEHSQRTKLNPNPPKDGLWDSP